MKKILCVLLCVALVAGVAVLSAGAVSDPVAQADEVTSFPWWYSLPGWVQGILRYLFFGWIWMNPPNPVTGVAFNGAPGYTLTLGKTQNLSWTITPANATNKGVVFLTSNSLVATVSSGGVVTAVGGGECTITVKTTDPLAADNYTDSITITVPVVLVTSIEISGAASVNIGGSAQYIANVKPDNASNKTVTWSILPSSTGSATIDNDGLLTTTAVGYVDLKATANDASGVSDTRRIEIKA